MTAIDTANLTAMLQRANLAELAVLAATEARRDPPRPYIAERIVKRMQKRVSAKLHKLTLEDPPRRNETADAYVKRLYETALKG